MNTDALDPFADDAGGYVLGALSADEERAFTAHLGTCPRCAAQVAELRPAVRLLANVSEADLARLDGPARLDDPARLGASLPELLARAAAQRRRRRLGVAALGAVAAAAVIALAVVIGAQPGTQPGSGSRPAAVGRPMVAVTAPGPLSASAALSSRTWGTEISLDCHYASSATSGRYPAAAGTYELEVVDRAGGHHVLGSWTVQPSGPTRFTSGTSLAVDQISAVRIDLPDGTPVLQLSR